MAYRKKTTRTILQRRNNLSNTVQQLLDGMAVIGVTWGLTQYHYLYIGGVTSPYMVMLLVLLGVLAITYDKFAIYRSNGPFLDKATDLLKAWTLTFLSLIVLAFLTKQTEAYSRYLLAELYLIGYLVQLFLHAAFRILYKKIILNPQQNEKALIVGQSRLAYYLQQKISNNPWIGEQVVGFVQLPDDNLASGRKKPGRKIDPSVLGEIKDLPALIDQYDISIVYIVTPLKSSKALEEIYVNILDKYVSIHWIPDIFALRLMNHSVKEISGIPVVTLSETPLIGMRLLQKAVEDRVLSALILLVISPILLLVALAIKLDSPGPVFFRQKRAGWSGKSFKIWKFRSMYAHKEEAGKLKQAEKNDSRITRVGAFIRKTSLDELPQIFNVLIGDMSLVGPRPHAMQHDAEYSQRIFDYFARHHIKPGITGLAQIRGLRGETKNIDQMIQRVESDIEYINDWSVWLDIKILLLTIFKLGGKTAY